MGIKIPLHWHTYILLLHPSFLPVHIQVQELSNKEEYQVLCSQEKQQLKVAIQCLNISCSAYILESPIRNVKPVLLRTEQENY